MKLNLNRMSIHIATGGRPHKTGAPYIIFVHGSGQTHLTWGLQTRYFAYEGYNIIAPDFPGHGLSGGQPLTSIPAMADWLIQVMGAVGVAAAGIVGHSQGCLIALDLASRYPARVSRLCLIAGAAAIPVNEGLIDASSTNSDAAIAMMTGWGHGTSAHFHDSPQPGFSHLGFGRAVMAGNDKTALHADLSACNAYVGGADAAASVTQPCHLILAQGDKMTPLKQGRKLAGLIPHSRVTEIAGAGHMLPAEQPDAVNAVLSCFLNSSS